jgi:hypothetical protein
MRPPGWSWPGQNNGLSFIIQLLFIELIHARTEMTFSLYAATVPSYQQILHAVSNLLDKAQAFCAEKAITPSDIVQARLADDMLPFAYQVKSTSVHSLGAIEAVRRGVFSPDMTPPPDTLPLLKSKIAETLAALAAIEQAEVDAFIGRDMRFEFRDRRIDFRREFPAYLCATEFLFPRRHGLRHSALEGDANWEARFHGHTALQALIDAAPGNGPTAASRILIWRV